MKSKPDNILDKKQIFLLLFARELIRNSGSLFLLKEILEKENPINPVLLKENKEPISEDGLPLTKSILSPQEVKKPSNEELSIIKPVSIKSQRREISSEAGRSEYPVLKIPEPRLPEEFQYLKPTPTRKEIDLEKLNSLIGDPMVREIECEGPNKPVIVSGVMGRKPTGIILLNNEIEDIINRFSRASKIPVDVGVFKVVVGNLIFSAIISDVVPSRFVITKMPMQNQSIITNPNLMQQNQIPPRPLR